MSDLFDKRPTSKSADIFDKKATKLAKKEAKTKEQLKAQKKTRTISISVISVFLIAFILATFLNSNIARREISVITIGDVGFSAAEFDYFYVTTYWNYRQWVEFEMAELAQLYLPVRGIPLSEQIHPTTGESWEAYIIQETIDNISELVKRYSKAIAAGFDMGDELAEEVELLNAMEMQQALQHGYQDLGMWLRHLYGPAMNINVLTRINEMRTIAFAFEQSVIPDFTFTQEELDEYYFENRDLFDVFDMRLFIMTPNVDHEAEDQEAAVNEAFDEAMQLAETFLTTIETQEDFIQRAREYNPFWHNDDDSTLRTLQGEQLPESLLEWLADDSRVYGDVAVVPDGLDTIYVVYFLERSNNNYLVTSFRQLLFLRQDPNNPISIWDFDDEDTFNAEIDRLDNEAYLLASEMKQRFIELGATLSAFDTIIEENEDLDMDGREYTDIAKLSIDAGSPNGISTMRVVPEIEEWLFEPGRQVGDYKLIRTEAFGFHLAYFTGFGDRFSDILAGNGLLRRESEAANEAWLETLEPVSVTKHRLFSIFTEFRSFS